MEWITMHPWSWFSSQCIHRSNQSVYESTHAGYGKWHGYGTSCGREKQIEIPNESFEMIKDALHQYAFPTHHTHKYNNLLICLHSNMPLVLPDMRGNRYLRGNRPLKALSRFVWSHPSLWWRDSEIQSCWEWVVTRKQFKMNEFGFWMW